ncbi:MAG: DISARM system phospholipase D-like protein DrmC [Planctomycetota bacterium]
MSDALFDLPAHLRRRLAGALESGSLRAPYTETAIRMAVGNSEGVEIVAESLKDLEKQGVAGRGAAAWIRAVEKARSRTPMPDLVWTGPEVPGVHARDTYQVFEELLGSAEHSIWASTYLYFDAPKAFQTLARRMDERPELKVTLFLNIRRHKNDTSTPDEIVRRFKDRFWNEWPGTRRPRVFYDPRSLAPDGETSVLHAKAIVADERWVFITSANFTEAAQKRNIELGVLLEDRALAVSTIEQFGALLVMGSLNLLPDL